MFLKLRSTKMVQLIFLDTCSVWLWKLGALSKTSPENLTLSVECTSVSPDAGWIPCYSLSREQTVMSSVFAKLKTSKLWSNDWTQLLSS